MSIGSDAAWGWPHDEVKFEQTDEHQYIEISQVGVGLIHQQTSPYIAHTKAFPV
jgi:hypothetical protein